MAPSLGQTCLRWVLHLCGCFKAVTSYSEYCSHLDPTQILVHSTCHQVTHRRRWQHWGWFILSLCLSYWQRWDGWRCCLHPQIILNIEIPSPFHGGAGRADKEPSHCSESVAGFKLPAYFSKVEHCGRDGCAMEQLATLPREGVGCLQPSRADSSMPIELSPLLQRDAAAWFWVAWRDFLLSFIAFFYLIIFGYRWVPACESHSRQCISLYRSAQGPLAFLFA